jgi:hypothetical protein
MTNRATNNPGHIPKDSEALALSCTQDLGLEITAKEIRTYLLSGQYPERLNADNRRDMQATLFKELLMP